MWKTAPAPGSSAVSRDVVMKTSRRSSPAEGHGRHSAHGKLPLAEHLGFGRVEAHFADPVHRAPHIALGIDAEAVRPPAVAVVEKPAVDEASRFVDVEHACAARGGVVVVSEPSVGREVDAVGRGDGIEHDVHGAVGPDAVELGAARGLVVRHGPRIQPARKVDAALVHADAGVRPHLGLRHGRAEGRIGEGDAALDSHDVSAARARPHEGRNRRPGRQPIDASVRADRKDVARKHVDDPQPAPRGMPSRAFAVEGDDVSYLSCLLHHRR